MRPDKRKRIPQRTLRDGAASEAPIVERFAKVLQATKTLFSKSRLGVNAAKQHEQLENAGEKLDGNTDRGGNMPNVQNIH